MSGEHDLLSYDRELKDRDRDVAGAHDLLVDAPPPPVLSECCARVECWCYPDPPERTP